MIALQRRRGAPEHNDALFDLGPHDGDIARVISRRFLLLISALVFFIDYDEAQVFERGKNRTARADDDARAATMNLVPFVMALAFG